MSVHAPFRRLSPRCLSYRPRVIAAQTQCRHASSNGKDDSAQENPILDEYLKKNPNALAGSKTRAREAQEAALEQQRQMMRAGDLAPSSIFEDDRIAEEQERRAKEDKDKSDNIQDEYNVEARRLMLDPDPGSRERWERKKVIQAIRKGGRMTREQMIKRTEREHLSKSENMKTSVKKLGMLARQIAGKSLDDAVLQMRFSKKKAAITVGEHLKRARDEAVAMRGMGLGATHNIEDPSIDEITPEETTPSTPATLIRLKDGSKYKVTDPTKLYIDQAWVGRGPYGKLPDYRARGRMFIMRTPFTSLSVILKEEATRVREHTDREVKQRKKRLTKIWKQLPDRPLQGPRGQYYSW